MLSHLTTLHLQHYSPIHPFHPCQIILFPNPMPKFVPVGSLIQSTAAKIYRYTQLLPAFHHKPLTLHSLASVVANG